MVPGSHSGTTGRAAALQGASRQSSPPTARCGRSRRLPSRRRPSSTSDRRLHWPHRVPRRALRRQALGADVHLASPARDAGLRTSTRPGRAHAQQRSGSSTPSGSPTSRCASSLPASAPGSRSPAQSALRRGWPARQRGGGEDHPRRDRGAPARDRRAARSRATASSSGHARGVRLRGGDVPRSGTGAVRALRRGRVVNLSLGIPFLRLGGARDGDIAWQGKASEESMTAALRTAGRMASRLDPGPIEWTWRPATVKWRAAAAERDDPLPRRHQGLSREAGSGSIRPSRSSAGTSSSSRDRAAPGNRPCCAPSPLPCCPTRARWRWKGRRAPASPPTSRASAASSASSTRTSACSAIAASTRT